VSADITYVCEQIDLLMTLEFRVYGMSSTDTGSTRGKVRRLYDAARDPAGPPLSLLAAQGLRDAVRPGDLVVISTGWVIPFWIPRGELDGIVGALALAHTLTRGLGARVVFLAEEVSEPVLRAGCLAAGLREYDVDFLRDNPKVGRAGGVAIASFPMDQAEAPAAAEAFLDTYRPAALVATEKAGRNRDDVYHTGLGNDFSEACIKVDYLFDAARERGLFTVGIIDFGNEIGSGAIAPAVRTIMPWADVCKCPCGGGAASTVETSSVVVAATCNFGAYAVVAALAALLDDESLLHTEESERLYMLECARAGAIDGTTVTSGGGRILNGVAIEDYLPVVSLLRTIVKARHVRYHLEGVRT